MKVTRENIKMFLDDVKSLIQEDKYVIENRDKNEDLILDYILSEEDRKRILLSLEVDDFSGKRNYTDNKGREIPHYVFGKEESLLERYGIREVKVSIYIKMYTINKGFAVVVSFHEEEYPITYYFK